MVKARTEGRKEVLRKMYAIADTMLLHCPVPSRTDVIRGFLRGASPRNPTYVLGQMLETFEAESSTELTVIKGEEVFMMYEIDSWVFVMLFSDNTRRGYVPVDYCDIIRDFYTLNPLWSKEERLSTSATSGSSSISGKESCLVRNCMRKPTSKTRRLSLDTQECKNKPKNLSDFMLEKTASDIIIDPPLYHNTSSDMRTELDCDLKESNDEDCRHTSDYKGMSQEHLSLKLDDDGLAPISLVGENSICDVGPRSLGVILEKRGGMGCQCIGSTRDIDCIVGCLPAHTYSGGTSQLTVLCATEMIDLQCLCSPGSGSAIRTSPSRSESGIGDSESVHSNNEYSDRTSLRTETEEFWSHSDCSTATSVSLEDMLNQICSDDDTRTTGDQHNHNHQNRELTQSPHALNSCCTPAISLSSNKRDRIHEVLSQEIESKTVQMSDKYLLLNPNKLEPIHSNQSHSCLQRWWGSAADPDDDSDDVFLSENEAKHDLPASDCCKQKQSTQPIIASNKLASRAELCNLSQRIKEKLESTRTNLLQLKALALQKNISQPHVDAKMALNKNIELSTLNPTTSEGDREHHKEECQYVSTQSVNTGRKTQRTEQDTCTAGYIKLHHKDRVERSHSEPYYTYKAPDSESRGTHAADIKQSCSSNPSTQLLCPEATEPRHMTTAHVHTTATDTEINRNSNLEERRLQSAVEGSMFDISSYTLRLPDENAKVLIDKERLNQHRLNRESDLRQNTLRSIQEQYLRLEEARLLHDALKHLKSALATSDQRHFNRSNDGESADESAGDDSGDIDVTDTLDNNSSDVDDYREDEQFVCCF